MDDTALLREYATDGSEAAFEALVERYVRLVYSAALRQTGNPHQAEEVTQAVFVILARKAGTMADGSGLSAWLFKTTRFVALAQTRTVARRRHYEQEAFMQSDPSTVPPDPVWNQIAPLLDEALAQLGDRDRQAVLHRFFEDKSFAEVGRSLGAGEDAARMRINRALDKLRRFFVKRGVTVSIAALAGVISANSVHAAPATLAKTVAALAVTKGAVAGGSTLSLINGALKIMAWTKIKTTAVVGACVLLAAGGATFALTQIKLPINGIPKDWATLSGSMDQWTWVNGAIHGHDTNGDSMLVSGREYADFTMSATMGTTNREATMVFRVEDQNNAYLVVFVPAITPREDAGHIALLKRVDGQETEVAIYRGHVFSTLGASAKVTISAQGPIIEVRMNDARVIRVKDTTFSRGLVGLRMYGDGEYPCDSTIADLTIR